MKKSFFSVCFVFLILPLFSQKPPAKFGKITPEELTVQACPIDSNAGAYYMFDFGISEFYYEGTQVRSNDPGDKKGFRLKFKRHFRIKILRNSGFEWANVEIPLYHAGKSREDLADLDAVTFNLEEGKVVKTKFDRDNLVKEERNNNITLVKFPLSAIREGSVIDVSYTINSDFLFNLQEWTFQHLIPTLHSEYHVYIPEYFNYNQTMLGYYPIKHSTSSRYDKITITYIQAAEGSSVDASRSTQEYQFKVNDYNYLGTDIPAFPQEKFLKTPYNYLSKIKFELASTKFPNSVMQLHTTSWDAINKDLMEAESFGYQLKADGFLKDDAALLSNSNLQGVGLMDLALNLIKSRIKWNGLNRVYVTSTLRRAYSDGLGSSSDVNLSLVALLRLLGFDANPVLLSTRENGLLNPAHPSVTDFNYVIALVKFEGKNYMMDATDPYSEINLLPLRCLNDKGRVVGFTGGEWVDPRQQNMFRKSSVINLSLQPDLTLAGKMQIEHGNYAAYIKRREVHGYNSREEYIQKFQSEVPGLSLTEPAFENLDTLGIALTESYNCSFENQVTKSGNVCYFNPLQIDRNDENPFRLEEREYPVEFYYPQLILQTIKIAIPEGYTVESMPKPAIFTLPDKAAKYVYNIVLVNNEIQLTSMLQVSRIFFFLQSIRI
ncbi:MAG: DUF3857 domain-containing protein [Bacteroidales bacterium]